MKESKRRCVYDLTELEWEYFDKLTESLDTTRIGLLRKIIFPGPIQDALVKAWKESEKKK